MSEGNGASDETARVFDLRSIERRFAGPDPETVRIGDLSFDRGRVTAILGFSGCGKSTLLNVISGLDTLGPRDDGEISFRPHPGAEPINWGVGERPDTRLIRRHVGFVFQSDELLDQFDAWTNVVLPRLFAGGGIEDVDSATTFRTVELKPEHANQNPGDRSGGQRARMAFLRALAHDPSVILCDEPTSDLDPRHADDLMSRLTAWRDQAPDKRSVICVTHDVHAAFRWADDIWVRAREPQSPDSPFVRFRRDPDHGWASAQWDAVRAHLQCVWVASEPPPREDAAVRPALPRFPPIEGPNGSRRPKLTWLHLGLRDFWRHPRAGGRFVQRLLPLSLLVVSILLYVVLFLGHGVERGIDQRVSRERADPSFRVTELRLRGERTDTTAAFLSRFPLAGARYERVYADFRLAGRGPEGEPIVDKRLGVALDSKGEVFRSIRGAIDPRTRDEAHWQAVARDGDRSEGLILSADLCHAIYGDGKIGRWVPLEMAQVIELPDRRTRTDRFAIPMPLLGCAPSLPSKFQFIATLGFARARAAGHRSILRPSTFYVTGLAAAGLLPEGPSPAQVAASERVVTQFADALEAELLARISEERPTHEPKLAIEVGGPLELRGTPVLRIEMFDGIHPRRLAKGWIFRAVAAARPGVRVAFDDAHRYPMADAARPADRWLFPLPLDVSANQYEQMIADADEAGAFADTAVVARLRAIERIGITLRGYNELALDGLLCVIVAVLLVIFVFDGHRRLRGYGIMRALGLRWPGYVAMGFGQAFVVQAIALGIAALWEWGPAPGAARWLFEHRVDFAIDYASFVIPGPQLAGTLIATAVVPVLVRAWFIFRRPPADLVRYRVL